MLKKLLASVGIGGAKVDTILLTDSVMPGGTFEAEVHIQAGEVEQDISGLDLALCTQVKVENDEGTHWKTHTLKTWRVCEKRTLHAGETLTLPVSGRLHAETPITQLPVVNNQTRVWLATGLDIDMARDASDKDRLNIAPTPAIQACMSAMNNLGYDLFKADVEAGVIRGRQFQSCSGCYQELEYRPIQRGWFGVKEVELSFIAEQHRTHVLVEIDRAFRGDGYRELTLEHSGISVETAQQQLQQLLG